MEPPGLPSVSLSKGNNMQRPKPELEKLFNKLGVYTRKELSLPNSSHSITVYLEVPLTDDEKIELADYGIETVSPRGAKIFYGEWSLNSREGKRYLAFNAMMKLPTGISLPNNRGDFVVSSFVDLCWNTGVEEVLIAPPDVGLPLAAGAVYQDLGWYLPSRFLDQLIDSLGKLNDCFFEGRLQDAILYCIV